MRGLKNNCMGGDRQTDRYICKLTSRLYEKIGLRADSLKSLQDRDQSNSSLLAWNKTNQDCPCLKQLKRKWSRAILKSLSACVTGSTNTKRQQKKSTHQGPSPTRNTLLTVDLPFHGTPYSPLTCPTTEHPNHLEPPPCGTPFSLDRKGPLEK